MSSTIVFALLAVGLATAILIHRAFAGLRARQRAVWELERAEWRRWISRP
jgi:hypothetical protein